MIKRLAIIPAKGTSKRIKNKNLKQFHGKPLLFYPINAAKQSKIFDKIHVSSDSEKVLKYANFLNIKTDFKRPKKLCHDKKGLFDVINFVVSEYEKMNYHFDEVWLLFTTNPFIKKKNILDCKKIFKKISYEKKNSLITVTKYNYPLEWALKKERKKNLVPIQNKKIHLVSKKIKDLFCEAGMINVYSTKSLMNNTDLKYFSYELPLYESVDIDTIEDFELAKRLFT